MVSTDDLRAAAHGKVDEADEATLIAILEADSQSVVGEPLNADELAELYRRIGRHKSGESKSYSWEQVKHSIEERRKNANL
jgi:hypothetical protein